MKQSPEERLAKKRAYAKAKYLERKAARVCKDCEAELSAVDGVRCEYCHDLDAERQRVYRQSEKHKRADRKRGTRRRAIHRSAGLCQFCAKPSGQYASCEEHRARAVAATNAWRERKRLGITRLPVKRAPIVDPSRLDAVDPEPKWTERVLRAMRWFDWASSTEACEAVGVTDPYSVDRNSAGQALKRLAKRGLLEQRKTKFKFDGMASTEYRITNAGRVLLGARRAA